MSAFPYKLHELLETAATDIKLSSIISWLPGGKSFRIHSQEEFEKQVMKKYFPRQSRVKSFKRQLQYYDFENFGEGLFSHPCFLQGQRHLCGRIIHQVPTKNQKAGGRSVRPLKARGRKKKMRSYSSLISTSSSSGSLKSRTIEAAARDASPVSFASKLSLASEPSPKVSSPSNIPKFVSGPASIQMGTMMPTPVLSANKMLSQPHLLAHLRHEMQAMQMARERYLMICLQQEEEIMSCLQQEEERLVRSMLQNTNTLRHLSAKPCNLYAPSSKLHSVIPQFPY